MLVSNSTIFSPHDLLNHSFFRESPIRLPISSIFTCELRAFRNRSNQQYQCESFIMSFFPSHALACPIVLRFGNSTHTPGSQASIDSKNKGDTQIAETTSSVEASRRADSELFKGLNFKSIKRYLGFGGAASLCYVLLSLGRASDRARHAEISQLRTKLMATKRSNKTLKMTLLFGIPVSFTLSLGQLIFF